MTTLRYATAYHKKIATPTDADGVSSPSKEISLTPRLRLHFNKDNPKPMLDEVTTFLLLFEMERVETALKRAR